MSRPAPNRVRNIHDIDPLECLAKFFKKRLECMSDSFANKVDLTIYTVGGPDLSNICTQ